MYSTTFALIVIVGIASVNLFLGFAAAVLMGRGPKSWADVDRALVFRSFSPELLGFGGKSVAAAPESAPPRHTKPVAVDRPSPRPVSATVEAAPESVTPIAPAAPPPVVEEPILTLKPLTAEPAEDDMPPEQLLDEQLVEWRDDEEADNVASISMLVLTAPAEETEPDATPLLREAIRRTMSSQIRRDRKLLTLAGGQFVWFSADVHPEDALMPVERIRQTIQKTHFEYYERGLEISVHAAVVAARTEDRASDLLKRLGQAIELAQQSNDDTATLDLGSGPKSAERLNIEVAESTCVLGQ